MKCLPLQRAEKILLASTTVERSRANFGVDLRKNNELPPAPRLEIQVPPSPNAFDLILLAASQRGPTR